MVLMGILDAAVTCSKKVKFIRIDGSTPAQTRGDLVNKFQQNADVRVAILSINAAGTGLTLTVSHCLCPVCTCYITSIPSSVYKVSVQTVTGVASKQDATAICNRPTSACRRAGSGKGPAGLVSAGSCTDM